MGGLLGLWRLVEVVVVGIGGGLVFGG
jgi:hypothetical protein